MSLEFIAHRINTVQELKDLPESLGIEVDLRDRGERLILQHDPFLDGENFEDLLKEYKNRGTLILNIKSERIEHKVLELIHKYQVKKYFFLDSSFPMIYLLSRQGEKNIALRFSEFESIDTILNMKGKANWVWIDCFRELPLNSENYKILKGAGFQLCLVSPELQGRSEEIESYASYLKQNSIFLDAICTKAYNISRWKIKLS